MQGITAHERWHHADGHLFEFYNLGRVLGMKPRDCFFAAIAAYSHAGVKDHGPVSGRGNSKITFWPNYNGPTALGVRGYVACGKRMWSDSGLDETDINSSVPNSSLFNRDAFDNWLTSKKAQKNINLAKKIKKTAGWSDKNLTKAQNKLGVQTKPKMMA